MSETIQDKLSQIDYAVSKIDEFLLDIQVIACSILGDLKHRPLAVDSKTPSIPANFVSLKSFCQKYMFISLPFAYELTEEERFGEANVLFSGGHSPTYAYVDPEYFIDYCILCENTHPRLFQSLKRFASVHEGLKQLIGPDRVL